METNPTRAGIGNGIRPQSHRLAVVVIAAVAACMIQRTHPVSASEPMENNRTVIVQDNCQLHSAEDALSHENIEEMVLEVTAYNAGDPSQTDDSPCISASGEDICLALANGHKRCAANFVPFGTRLHIQDFGECTVVDRMNSRYPLRVDIAMDADEKHRALKFGIKNLEIKILK